MVQPDVKNAFNEANRQTAFHTVNGKASEPYDDGNVQPGENIFTFPDLRHAFPYFRRMHSDRSINRFFDHKDVSHTIYGTAGSQQGNPLENAQILRHHASHLGADHEPLPHYTRCSLR